MSKVIHKKLWMKYKKPNMSKWEAYKEKLYSAKEELNIWIAVKYHWLEDAYLSVIEALWAAWIYNWKKIVLEWIDTEAIENWDKEEYKKLKNCAWICVPGGFWNRGTEWKIQVAKFCRENKVPYLGLCLWSQILAIEFARSIWLEDAHSEEFDNKTPNQIFKFLPDQHEEKDIWGTLRLGSYPCKIKPWTLAEKCYWANLIDERHRHRYEFNNEFKEQLASKWLVISWTSPDWNLMEIVEIKDHPFMIWSQFHPEFKSRPYEAHPLFDWFIKACV
jgi:CTP synthase